MENMRKKGGNNMEIVEKTCKQQDFQKRETGGGRKKVKRSMLKKTYLN